MKAVVHDRYGPPDVLRLEDVERPVPGEDQLLIRIHATTVNRTDCGFRSAELFITRFFTGVLRPKQRIPGMEFAGVVEPTAPPLPNSGSATASSASRAPARTRSTRASAREARSPTCLWA